MTKGAQVRSRLDHPVIDADGHWLEMNPVFFDYIREVAGTRVLEYMRTQWGNRSRPWYQATPSERQASRLLRPFFWTTPTSARDRAAAIVPRLFRERLDDWGIDVAVVYPSIGLGLTRDLGDAEIRMGVIRAYNTMVADLFRPYSDRIVPVGVLSLIEPSEAIAQLEHARTLGLKLLVTGGSIPRPCVADEAWQPDRRRRRVFVDGLAMDSAYDYDPVWNKLVELRMPLATHSGSMGWPDRSSPTNFVANHVGHFAQSHHLFARNLFLGGVTQRFPDLNVGFLEGGVGWACSLYADLMGHWEKRNREHMLKHLRPTNIDRAELRTLLERYTEGEPRFEGKLDEILNREWDPAMVGVTPEEATARDLDDLDDFARVKIESRDDFARLFARNFYFGCEADDPMTAVAFDERIGLRLKPVLGSDISHFDVIDPAEVLGEAWEMVEHGLINEDNFRDFSFANAVGLFAGMNPDFFKGTVLEDAVRRELAAQARASQPARPPERAAAA